MHAKGLSFAALLVLAGCARASSLPTPVPASSASDARRNAAVVANESEDASGEDVEARAATAPMQKPGDYVVYRFSGSFRKAPLTLTERVLEAKRGSLRLELVFENGKTKRVVRATYDRTPGAVREIVDATRVDTQGAEHPMTGDEIESMMAETALAADANEASLGTESVTVDLGGQSLKCDKASWRVVIGKHKAIMTALTSDAFPWSDVGGEIKTDDGKVLYHAEVVDTGSSAPAVAQSE
jgi:hypothetical protein